MPIKESMTSTTPHSPESLQDSGRHLNSLLTVTSAIVLTLLWLSFALTHHTAVVRRPQIETVLLLQREVSLAHLWLEELMAANPSSPLLKTSDHLEAASLATSALLDGSTFEGNELSQIIDPPTRAALKDVANNLEELRSTLLKHLLNPDQPLDADNQDFNQRFLQLRAEGHNIEERLQIFYSRQTNQFLLINGLAIAGVACMWVVSSYFVHRCIRQNHENLRLVELSRRDAEAKQRMLATTLHSMSEGILTTNAHGLITYMNPSAAALTGLPPQKVTGLPADGVIGAMGQDTIPQPLSPVASVISTRKPFEEPAGIFIQTASGARRPTSISASPILSDSGELLGTVVALRDMTVQKSAEAKILAASRAKSEFLANMSHELRTPISGILGMTELVLMRENNPTLREYLGLIQNSAQDLLYIINDVLDLAKVESGKLVLINESYSIRAVLDMVMRLFALPAQQKGLLLSLHVDPNLPKTLIGDPRRLEQVLRNLLSNAIKFTEQGSISLTVGAEQGADLEPMVLFSVRDTGIGIPDNRLGDLFQSFTQLDASSSKRFAGTGLGLAISKEMVELMEGHIGVESRLGHGSVFFFTLPLRPSFDCIQNPQALSQFSNPMMPRTMEAKSIETDKTAPTTHHMRILVAEDDPTNRVYIETLLAEEGHDITLANNGHQALEALRQEPFDMVLMDVQMPGMDGVEAVHLIRQGHGGAANSNVPIIALTAYAMKGDRERFMEDGMDGYLAKPLEIDLFWQELKTVRAMRQKRSPSTGRNGHDGSTAAATPDDLPGAYKDQA